MFKCFTQIEDILPTVYLFSLVWCLFVPSRKRVTHPAYLNIYEKYVCIAGGYFGHNTTQKKTHIEFSPNRIISYCLFVKNANWEMQILSDFLRAILNHHINDPFPSSLICVWVLKLWYYVTISTNSYTTKYHQNS